MRGLLVRLLKFTQLLSHKNIFIHFNFYSFFVNNHLFWQFHFYFLFIFLFFTFSRLQHFSLRASKTDWNSQAKIARFYRFGFGSCVFLALPSPTHEWNFRHHPRTTRLSLWRFHAATKKTGEIKIYVNKDSVSGMNKLGTNATKTRRSFTHTALRELSIGPTRWLFRKLVYWSLSGLRLCWRFSRLWRQHEMG